jgi:flagellar biosynthesis protein FlhF
MTLMRKQLEAGLNVEENFLTIIPSKIICLVGASGSGKTTTISKLAVHFSKSLGKKVIWVSADTVRAGAIAETRAYADAIGVPLRLVYTPEDLTNLIQANHQADILLIDTPGYNPCDEEQMVELGAMLTRLPERSTYLVSPATTKEADLIQAVASLGLFKIRGLIITKMDETYSFGSVYNFVYQSQLPMALFSSGKQILGDLRQATAGKIVSALFGKGWD